MITEKARAIRAGARLLEELWPEITKAAVYLYNRCPKYTDSGDRVFVRRHCLEVLTQFLDSVTCDYRDRGVTF